MTIKVVNQNIFESADQAIVITVNCVGVMGKGVADGFKSRYKNLFLDYVRHCRGGRTCPGVITYHQFYRLPNGQFAILFPTKYHWKNPSRIEWIESGLRDLLRMAQELNLDTLSLPPPGCGNGGLDWATDVKPLVDKVFADSSIAVTVYDWKSYGKR